MRIGVDIGFGYTKGFDGKDQILFHQPSVVGEPVDLYEGTLKEKDTILHLPEKSVFVGNLADRQSQIKYTSLYEDRNSIGNNKYLLLACISHAMSKSVFDKSVYLVTGLPVSYYFKQKDEFTNFLSNIPRHYSATIGQFKFNTYINDLKHKVILQPLGAFFQYFLNKDGTLRDDRSHELKLPVCVLDLGFFTLDILSMNGMEIDHNRSHSSNTLGSNVAYKLIQQGFMKNTGRLLSYSDIDAMVMKGEQSELVDWSFQVLGEQILNEFYSLNQTYGLVLLTGGNAPRIAPVFENIRHYIPENPATAIVEGYYNLGARTWRTVATQ